MFCFEKVGSMATLQDSIAPGPPSDNSPCPPRTLQVSVAYQRPSPNAPTRLNAFTPDMSLTKLGQAAEAFDLLAAI